MLADFKDAEDDAAERYAPILREVAARLASGLTLQRVAWLSGVENVTLNRLLAGEPTRQYGRLDDHDTAEAFAALEEWLESEKHGASDDAGYALTPTFSALQTIYTHAHQWGVLVAIAGAWGIGKTEAASYYAANHPRTHDGPGAVRIQFSGMDRTPGAALAKIAERLCAGAHAYRNKSHMGAIVDALRPGDMLILEECQLLSDAMDVISDIHDATGITIVIQGNPDISGMMWGKRARFARLANRANRYDFPQSTPEDVEAWLAWRGAGEGMTVTERKALTEAACAIACRPTQNGGLRALADVFRMAERFHGEKINAGNLTDYAARFKPDAPGARLVKP